MSHDSPGSAPVASAAGHEEQAEHGADRFWILALGSIGVVFGDIGTSPLYALQTALGQFSSPSASRKSSARSRSSSGRS
jgi:KUP system potassium uptake protein